MELNFNWRFDIKNLPGMVSIKKEAKELSKDITVGNTLFFQKHGVKSEREYKEKMMKEGHIMKHSAIGLNTWDDEVEGLHELYEDLFEKDGSYIDRYGACLDWVMGVPDHLKDRVQPGASLILKNDEEWAALGQVVPIQPHCGDHMLGSLNSVQNAMRAIKAGVTTVGNFAQYTSYEYPGMDLEEYRTVDLLKGVGIMAEFADQGTIIHSNLDDGDGAQYHDLANLVGYARLERYIVEDLMDARIGHCFGNLFSDPMVRIVFNSTMWKINKFKTPGTMIYGNTLGFSETNMPRNYGNISAYSMADALGQMICPTGHAITPIPTTEAVRVPTIQEIRETHNTVDRAIEAAADYLPYIDMEKIEAESDLLARCGNIYFERVINAFDDLGININHAGEVLAALKAVNTADLEVNFGVGQKEKDAMRGRIPVKPTAIVMEMNKQQADIEKNVQETLDEKPLNGINIVCAATDVHEFGKDISKSVVSKAGANVFDLGTNVAVEEIGDTIIETGSKALLISTYNGIAFTYAKQVVESLKEQGIEVPIVMGGRLNEIVEGEDAPVDVRDKIAELGVNVDNDIEKTVDYLISALHL